MSAGFERFPEASARYLDADPAVSGGADSRWKPWGKHSVEVARIVGESPKAGRRLATQQAYLLSLRGDRDGAAAELAKVKQRFPETESVYWSEGWIRLNLLDFEGALVAWQQAQRLHGGQPFWVPYSKAIALMGLGDEAGALAWWSVAQRSHGPELASADAARAKFAHWRYTEKLLLEDLIQIAFPGAERMAVVEGSGLPYMKLLSAPAPVYPPALLRQAIEGETLVRLRVGADGVPAEVTIERSSGQDLFDQAALNAARLVRFEKSEKADPNGVYALMPYRFSLRPAPDSDAPKAASDSAVAQGREAEISRIIEKRMAEMRAEQGIDEPKQ
ncbi:MAG: TonB family protein [Lysobacterales bacterium]